MTGFDIAEGSLDEPFRISSLRIQGCEEGDSIRCRISEGPCAILIKDIAIQNKRRESPVFDIAIIERAIDELVAVKQHILTLK